MATIAIGDIHGNLRALSDLLERLAKEVKAGDTVVFLGDYIDRGSDTRGCIEAILEFQTITPASVVCLLGNHEDWLLRTMRDFSRHSWILGMEAFTTISSYSQVAARELMAALERAGEKIVTSRIELPYAAFFESLPQSHLAFFKGLSTYWRTRDAICVHGGLDPALGEVEEQSGEALLWGTEDFQDQYRGSEMVVYGHWDNGRVDSRGWPQPLIRANTIGIDTISHGVLTAVKLPDRRVIQSRHLPDLIARSVPTA